jgi:hypothetical protein
VALGNAMTWIVPLYYFCSFAGLVMVVGGIWLVYKEKIVIDRESKQVTEIETPFGKFRTNLPALVLFALGFVPLIFPIVRSVGYSTEMRIQGRITSGAHPVSIYAVVTKDVLQGDGVYNLHVPAPFGRAADYSIMYVVGGEAQSEDIVDPSTQQSGIVTMRDTSLAIGAAKQYVPGEVASIPDEFK